ncbi:hypothetical protein Tco_0698766 [Tanacetum coccineum]
MFTSLLFPALSHNAAIACLQGDEVFSTWMTFGGNTSDLGSFGEETDEITTLHQDLGRKSFSAWRRRLRPQRMTSEKSRRRQNNVSSRNPRRP